MEENSFYNKVGKINGWNFDHLQVTTEGIAKEISQEVYQLCSPTDIVLDIGTGGGERLLNLADSVLLAVGIDLSQEMIKKAQNNCTIQNVRFAEMPADNLLFPDQFFDVITCRHAPFFAKEVERVLKQGGTFLTQQVSEGDKINLKQAFGRGQAFEIADGTLKERYRSAVEDAGFDQIQVHDIEEVEYYQRPEDLIFLLKHTPIIPNFGEQEDDWIILEKYITEHQTEQGIKTNTKKFLIVARK